MKRFLCVILALIITVGCVFCFAAEPDWNGPEGESPLPTVRDTGRGYIVYYWYTPGIYYSPDGVTWTDLSDRSWVKEAADYRYITLGGLGTREFDLLWTGSEYMLRQSLKGDPRPTHTSLLGDSPRNRIVTFLDEDFQVIGEQSFDAPVTAIRCADGTYYATVGGVETAFSRRDWSGEPPKSSVLFSDVPDDAWYAPYVEVCVEDGLMRGTSDTTFSPDRELTLAEILVLTARLSAKVNGDVVPQIDDHFFEMVVFTDADGQRLGTLLDKRSAPVLSGLQNIWLFSFQEETLAHAAQRPITLTLDTSPLAEYPRSLLNAFGFSDPGVVQGTWTGVWDEDLGCYAVDFGDDIQNAPEFMIGLSNLTAVCAINRSQGLWYHSELAYLLVSDVSLDCLESVAPTDWLEHPRQWLETAATRGDFGALLGQLLPSPVVTQVPEDIREIDDLGVRALIFTGVMEGTGAGYALDKGLTRAECAAMIARVLRPELRKNQAPEVPVRSPEELTQIAVQHRSFGMVEVQYTLDLEKNSLEVLSPATFGREEEKREISPLDPAAVDAFRASSAVESLLGWGEVYYNMNILDGHQWTVTLTFSDGTSRDISGSNAYPEGWDLMYYATLELTGQNIMSTTSDWLDRDE